jgi:hypothetical protein
MTSRSTATLYMVLAVAGGCAKFLDITDVPEQVDGGTGGSLMSAGGSKGMGGASSGGAAGLGGSSTSTGGAGAAGSATTSGGGAGGASGGAGGSGGQGGAGGSAGSIGGGGQGGGSGGGGRGGQGGAMGGAGMAGKAGAGGGGGAGGAGGGVLVGNAAVLQYHNNLSRDGLYVDANFTKTAAVGIHRDPGFSAAVAGPTFAQPLYFEGAAGGKRLVIVATAMNQVYAFDAVTGATVWQRQVGTPAPRNSLPCGNMNELGIVGTPVIDAATKTLFFDAMTTGPARAIHALSLDDGSERAGWPVNAATAIISGGIGFDPSVQSQRAATTLVNGTLYVPYGGFFGDCGNYRGWVAGIPIGNPTQVKSWSTSALKSGIWGPGGIASDGTQLFVTTGNSSNTANYGQQESIVRLQAGPTFSGAATDYFAPSNWLNLDNADVDLGGSGPILVDVPGATPSKLVVGLGKDGNIYLANAANLGGISTPGANGEGVGSLRVASNQIIQAGAAYRTATATYVVFKGNGMGCPSGSGDLTAVRISAASPPKPSVAWCATQGGNGSPIVTTTDGQADAIVWSLGSRLVGFDGDTGAVIFNGGGASDTISTLSKFVTPIVARGRIYVAADANVYSFVLK